MADVVEEPGARWGSWESAARHEDGTDPLPGIIAVRYTDALAAGEDAYRLGRPSEALEHLAKAAALARRRALPQVLQAEIQMEAGHQSEAIAAYERALKRDANDGNARAGYRWALALAPIRDAAVTPPARQRPKLRLGARRGALILVPYLALITLAELAVTFVNPVLVFPLHGGMIAVLAIHLAMLGRAAQRDSSARYLSALLLTLILSPLIRLISLTLPLPQLPSPHQFLFAGIPMSIGAFMVARYVGFRPTWIGLIWRGTAWQLVAVTGSVAIGFVEFVILRPEPLGDFPWTAAGALPALSVMFATGFPEELIFRGMMQTAARPLIGAGWNVLYVSLFFAALHLGYQSFVDLIFVFAVSLFYGWIFERSRSIVGVSIGHGLANAILFFVAPNL